MPLSAAMYAFSLHRRQRFSEPSDTPVNFDALTHVELFERIKAIVLDNTFPRSTKIDLQTLADRFRVSTTPIREVLYQLVGERLIEPDPSSGFRCKLPTPTELRDLYEWNGQHLLTAVHLLPDPVMRRVIRPIATIVSSPQTSEPADLMERLSSAIAEASGNAEFIAQVAMASDRLKRARFAEALLFSDLRREIASIIKINGFDVRNNVRRRLLAYHRRRVESAAQIAALIA